MSNLNTSHWSSDFVKANGIRQHYYRTGGDKPPIIMLHGYTDNGLCWSRFANILQDNFDVIMPDARGHGLSDAPPSGYDVRDRVADVAYFLDVLHIENPALIGHSMGASTVATAATEFHEQLRCCILEDPVWFDETTPFGEQVLNHTHDELRQQIFERQQQIEEMQSMSHERISAMGRERSPSWDEVEFEAWEQAKLQVSPNAARYIEEPQVVWSDIVPKIGCPTLLIIGDPAHSPIVTARIANEARSINPNMDFIQFLGAGHNIRREAFGQFVRAVTSFLNAH